ncbi:MAG TPA: VOC family protein [Candidatus Limnocylindria bacterium]|jgi:hypothetical protein|nr:VOC family protein [Candidatus Limnocylindria bacterium]
MLHGIDHVVIAASDPDEVARRLEGELGLAVGGGGQHQRLGTFNRIFWLADGSYLELMGVDDPDEAAAWAMGQAAVEVLAAGGGFAGYALDDRPLVPDVNVLRGYGSEIGDPMEGTRVRLDGEVVEWRTALPPRIGPEGLPFLIEHVMTGAEWGADALAERAAFRHPIGSPVMLAGLDIAADDPAALAAEYSKQLGIEMRWIGDSVVASVGQQTIRLVPRHLADAPVVVRLGADAAPRTLDLFDLRFVVERVELPLTE